MYGHTARKALMRVFREAPELRECHVPDTKGRQRKLRATDHRKLADRLLVELWMMGFAVSARKPADRPPSSHGRSHQAHEAWRASKTAPTAQTDVEEGHPPAPDEDRAPRAVSEAG